MPEQRVSEIQAAETERQIKSDWHLFRVVFCRGYWTWLTALLHFQGVPGRKNGHGGDT